MAEEIEQTDDPRVSEGQMSSKLSLDVCFVEWKKAGKVDTLKGVRSV